MRHAQSGNVLFLILIAIALLGALAALLSRTGSQSDDTGHTEQAAIQASDLLRYAASLENGVKTLIARGCSENEISFDDDPDNTNNYTNANAPADKSCHLFFPQGAGLKKKFSYFSGTDNMRVYGAHYVPGIGRDCANPSCSELFLVLRLNSTDLDNPARLCNQINRIAGNPLSLTETSRSDDTPNSNNDLYLFKGVFYREVGTPASFHGKKAFCGKINDDSYTFNYVLLAR